MARLAVMASGSGSNFEAIAAAIRADGRHELVLLVCDRKAAFAFERAKRLGIPHLYVSFVGRERAEAEAEITAALEGARVDLVALAGYMRLLGNGFVKRWEGRLVNIHPALLPLYPGVDSIKRAWEAGDARVGVTIHHVDGGIDTGPHIRQASIERIPGESLEALTGRVHGLEHEHYPREIIALLDGIEKERKATR